MKDSELTETTGNQSQKKKLALDSPHEVPSHLVVSEASIASCSGKIYGNCEHLLMISNKFSTDGTGSIHDAGLALMLWSAYQLQADVASVDTHG